MEERVIMDTSKEYIKMCENWDLQTDRVPQVGDFYTESIRDGAGTMVFVISGDDLKYTFDPNYYTWLPRQDQLQEMVLGQITRAYNLWTMITHFNEFSRDSGTVSMFDRQTWYYMTMEKLWLAFVMKEKFNKIWDGKNWINQN